MKKFISWNVNGIRACVGKGFLDSFKELDADIFCLQETKLQAGQIELDLPGYHQYWNYAEKKGYSGTAVFTKAEPISVFYGMDKSEHDTEGRLITLEFENFYFVCCYTPNAQDGLKRIDYRMKWEDDLREYLTSLSKNKPLVYCGDLNETQPSYISTLKKKPVIFCGDLNVAANPIDLKNPQSNRNNAGYSDKEREKFSELLSAGFVDTFRYLHPDEVKYSWWSYRFKAREKNAGWRIDYFLISEFAKELVKNADILTDITGSDHCPVLLQVDI